jgi:hypothetical protein
MFLRTDEIDYSSQRSQGRRGNPRKQLRLTPGFGNVASAAGCQLAHPMCRRSHRAGLFSTGPRKLIGTYFVRGLSCTFVHSRRDGKLFSVEECAMKFIVNGSALRKSILFLLVMTVPALAWGQKKTSPPPAEAKRTRTACQRAGAHFGAESHTKS